jgi:hypothetical protein
MAEYIERNAVRQAMRDPVARCFQFTEYDLDKITMADVVPVRHGRWVKDGDFLICLNCESEINIKNSLGVENHKNYCPNCGAKIDLEDE